MTHDFGDFQHTFLITLTLSLIVGNILDKSHIDLLVLTGRNFNGFRSLCFLLFYTEHYFSFEFGVKLLPRRSDKRFLIHASRIVASSKTTRYDSVSSGRILEHLYHGRCCAKAIRETRIRSRHWILISLNFNTSGDCFRFNCL